MKILIKKSVTLLSLIFVALACKTKQISSDVKDTYQVVYKSQNGGKKEKSNVIIKNYEEYNTLISELKIGEEEYENLLNINLEKNNLLVCFLGEKTTGGYDIDIETVKFTPTTAEVFLKNKMPEKHSMVTMAFTSPYVFVTLPKNKTILVK